MIVTLGSHWRRSKDGCCLGEPGENQKEVQFHSVQSHDWSGGFLGVFFGGDIRDYLSEILFQSFLLEALVSGCDMGRDVHSMMLSIQHFLCWPRCHPPSKVPWRMVWRGCLRMWHVWSWQLPEQCDMSDLDSCQNNVICRILTVARTGFCGPIRKLTQKEVLGNWTIWIRIDRSVLCT